MHRQIGHISELKQECEKVKIKYEDELKKTTKVEKEFLSATQEIQKVKQNLTSTLEKIDTACSTSINQASSTYDVIDTMGLLLQVVCPCSRSPPSIADSLSSDKLKLEIFGSMQPTNGLAAKQVEWKIARRFNLPPHFEDSESIAISQHDDIVVTSSKSGVVILSRTGHVKSYFTNCCKCTVDIAVTPCLTRLIAPGNSKFLCYSSYGKQLFTINVADGVPQVMAVDKCSRIITYTGVARDDEHPWSILGYNGGHIHSFSTPGQVPFRLEATYLGDIVYSQIGDKKGPRCISCTDLKLMDYFGDDVRVVKPPPQVTSWDPRDVCCSKQQSEIYVINRGHPEGIYKYTAEGDYVSCVTTDVRFPTGIALSPCDRELFVVERGRHAVTKFQR